MISLVLHFVKEKYILLCNNAEVLVILCFIVYSIMVGFSILIGISPWHYFCTELFPAVCIERFCFLFCLSFFPKASFLASISYHAALFMGQFASHWRCFVEGNLDRLCQHFPPPCPRLKLLSHLSS